MRCKVGDLCFVTHSRFTENIGRLVIILQASVNNFPRRDWQCEPDGSPLIGHYGGNSGPVLSRAVHFFDHQLRPIRPDEGQDETHTWKFFTSPVEIIKELA